MDSITVFFRRFHQYSSALLKDTALENPFSPVRLLGLSLTFRLRIKHLTDSYLVIFFFFRIDVIPQHPMRLYSAEKCVYKHYGKRRKYGRHLFFFSLTPSQTANFRFFQTRSFCRRQYQTW